MGTITNRGRDIRVHGTRLLHTVWLEVGMPNLTDGGTSYNFPWPDENNPPSEDPEDDDPNHTDMFDLFYGQCGIKLATTTGGAYPVTSGGTVIFNGQHYLIDDFHPSMDSNMYFATHFYARFDLQPSDWSSDGLLSIVGYRRLGIWLDFFKGVVSPPATARRQDALAISGSQLLFYSNELLRTRSPGEIHTIELVLPM